VAESSRMPLLPMLDGVPKLRRRIPWVLGIFTLALCGVVCAAGWASPDQEQAKQDAGQRQAEKPLGVEIVERGSYPELEVDGKPFFIESAAFFYYRIPRDQWEYLLDRYARLGINTIDIYIPWNWHEPKAGELDFDGRTNLRRDLRALLKMIAERHLRLIARPGPEILNEWRNGGYPDWLLSRPEYKMDSIDILEGRYPPLDGLNAKDAEAAAEGWLANPTHMAETREWLEAVGKELAPYSSRKVWKAAGGKDGVEEGGPLLFVQLGDDFAIGRTNRVGPAFWKYVEALRSAIEAGGVNVPVFINPADMRVSAAGSALKQPIGVMGQWYMRPGGENGPVGRTLTAQDATEIEFLTQELGTQPMFPPVMIEYQAGWYAPAYDDRPPESPPENTLLSSRLMIANGLHGINYFPLQDTYTPAGYSVPWANRSYRWNAALSTDGEVRPELAMVERNANLLRRWGPALAASHKRTDFGIIDPVGSYPQNLLEAGDIERMSRTIERIERAGTLAMLSSELLDPEHESLDQLLRDAMVLLPVLSPDKPQFRLSEKAQQLMVAYVRSGGTLVLYLGRPAGDAISELWKGAPQAEAPPNSPVVHNRWKFGEGEVIECTKDFDSWVALDDSLSENLAEPQANYSLGLLDDLIEAAGIEPAVKMEGKSNRVGGIIASELVENEGTEDLGKRKGRRGFLSVTNLANGEPVDVTLEALNPGAAAKSISNSYMPVRVVIPPRESMLLPLNQPICFEEEGGVPCEDALVSSGAEFLDAKRDEKTLEALFYVPAKEEMVFHLEMQPSHVTLDDSKPDSQWSKETHELHVTVPRGPAPTYFRLLKIDLPYAPHVPKLVRGGKPTPEELTLSVWNAVRLPVSYNESLRTYPPLIVAVPGKTPSVVVAAFNLNSSYPRTAQINVQGPLHGGEDYLIAPQNSEIEKIALKSSEKDTKSLPVGPDGLIHETMEVKSGQDRRVIPLTILPLHSQGTTAYWYDFDRDGEPECVLEDAALRLIISPESGGRAIALMDKTGAENLSTSVGLIRDNFLFTPNPPGINPVRARGLYGMFNRKYSVKRGGDATNPTYELHYDAPDVYPGGASIDKTVRLEDPATVRVDYRVKLLAGKSGDDGTKAGDHAQSFVAVNSFPATGWTSQPTQFCWGEEAKADAKTAGGAGNAGGEPASQCVNFSPGGKAVEVPDGVTRVEVRSPGQTTMALAWECDKECARLEIEQENYSGLFRLVFPAIKPGGEAGVYTVRIEALLQP